MKEKQIEEMTCENCLHHFACLVNSEYVPSPCPAYENKSEYRKQSEGEWIETQREWDFEPYFYTDYTCSVCGDREQDKRHFCPNCGAKMKGE